LKGKLEAGKYASYAEAAYDMRLIWYNSMLYNTPGSKIYSLAKVMSEYFESQCAIHFPSDPDRLPSNEEMSQWVQQCHRLSSEELGQILKKIDEAQPDCLFKVIHTLN